MHLTQLGAPQACSVQGMRALWCPCACSQGLRGSLHHVTAAVPAVCGLASQEPGSPALLSLEIWLLRPVTAALPGADSPIQASTHPRCTLYALCMSWLHISQADSVFL